MAPRGRLTHKSIYDPVHGPIRLEGLPLALIGTRAFQRLWGLHQTGFAHLVFPGANHTRLEHSLGAHWVATEMARRLELSPDEIESAGVGALLHDLGHTPFSHTLEPTLREVWGVGHEAISRARITGRAPSRRGTGRETEDDRIASLLESHGLSPRAIADLIDPPVGRDRSPIVRSLLHGAIDADRLDYLQRDAYYTGVAHGAIDAVRLLDTIRTAGRRVGFAEKGRNAVEGFLVGRTLMYGAVYYHKTVRAAELMAQAAVERSPGYPDSAVSLLASVDGELLTRLADRGGLPRRLVSGLVERRLYKRAFRWVGLTPGARARWKRLVERPESRRAWEDRVAEKVGAEPGGVLLDLCALEPRGDALADWEAVPLVGDRGVSYPFRAATPWRSLIERPIAESTVAIYAAPRYREAVGRRFARGADAFD